MSAPTHPSWHTPHPEEAARWGSSKSAREIADDIKHKIYISGTDGSGGLGKEKLMAYNHHRDINHIIQLREFIGLTKPYYLPHWHKDAYATPPPSAGNTGLRRRVAMFVFHNGINDLAYLAAAKLDVFHPGFFRETCSMVDVEWLHWDTDNKNGRRGATNSNIAYHYNHPFLLPVEDHFNKLDGAKDPELKLGHIAYNDAMVTVANALSCAADKTMGIQGWPEYDSPGKYDMDEHNPSWPSAGVFGDLSFQSALDQKIGISDGLLIGLDFEFVPDLREISQCGLAFIDLSEVMHVPPGPNFNNWKSFITGVNFSCRQVYSHRSSKVRSVSYKMKHDGRLMPGGKHRIFDDNLSMMNAFRDYLQQLGEWPLAVPGQQGVVAGNTGHAPAAPPAINTQFNIPMPPHPRPSTAVVHGGLAGNTGQPSAAPPAINLSLNLPSSNQAQAPVAPVSSHPDSLRIKQLHPNLTYDSYIYHLKSTCSDSLKGRTCRTPKVCLAVNSYFKCPSFDPRRPDHSCGQPFKHSGFMHTHAKCYDPKKSKNFTANFKVDCGRPGCYQQVFYVHIGASCKHVIDGTGCQSEDQCARNHDQVEIRQGNEYRRRAINAQTWAYEAARQQAQVAGRP